MLSSGEVDAVTERRTSIDEAFHERPGPSRARPEPRRQDAKRRENTDAKQLTESARQVAGYPEGRSPEGLSRAGPQPRPAGRQAA